MAYPHGLISWTDISLPDPAGGGKFYADLFGWKAAASGHGRVGHPADVEYLHQRR